MTQDQFIEEMVEEFECRVIRAKNISGGGCAVCGSKADHDTSEYGSFTHQYEYPTADDMIDDSDWLRTTLKQVFTKGAEMERARILEAVDNDIKAIKVFADKKQSEGDTRDTTLGYITGLLAANQEIRTLLTTTPNKQ